MASLGIPDLECFNTVDLYEEKDFNMVMPIPFVFFSLSLFVCFSVCLITICICLSVYVRPPPLCLSVCVSLCLSLPLSVCVSLCLSLLSLSLSNCPYQVLAQLSNLATHAGKIIGANGEVIVFDERTLQTNR